MSEQTQVIEAHELDDAAEAERAEQRAARDRSLGKVERPANEPVTMPQRHPRTTDRFFGSLGLFLLRLVTAGIIGVHGFQKLTDINATTDFFTQVGVPSPHYMAWGVGIAEVAAALALVFGILTRVAGLGVAAIAVGALVMVKWGKVNPFQHGVAGFTGEFELLLAAVGVVITLLGAGRWSVDGSIRAGRDEARQR